MSLISIIVPCYNSERFLPETINSILDQTYSNYELILIDDGSTDKTAEIIKSYGNKVIAKFTENRGASAARNLGTSLAKGDFIQYVDADDILLPNAMEKRVNALIETGADVAYSSWQRLEEKEDNIFEKGDIINRKIEDIDPDPQIALFTDFWSPPVALLYKRGIVEKIGTWNESLPIIQDARFLLDAALFGGNFIHIPEVSAYYRVHKNASLSKRNKLRFTQDCFENACQVEDFWYNNGGITTERQKALIKVYGQSARFFFEYERSIFNQVMNKIYHLDPNYIPENPKILKILSKIVGYENAEKIALMYRTIKKYY